MPYPRQPSRYLGEDLEAFRTAVASFVDAEIRPRAEEWERAGEIPRELYVKAGTAGLIGLRYDSAWGGGEGSFLATCVLTEELVKGEHRGSGGGVDGSVRVRPLRAGR